ncbi:MAG: DUF2846 domain-containing protein [Cellvibrio sp.]
MFSEPYPVNSDFASIYLYYPSSVLGGAGAAMEINGETIGFLQQNSFIYSYAQSGSLKINSKLTLLDVEKIFELNAQSGEEYFLKMIRRDKLLVEIYSLVLVDRDTALAELRSCCSKGIVKEPNLQ